MVNHDNIHMVLNLINASANSNYIGEAISQKEHALQAAFFSEQAGQAPELVIASLLHDIGHLIDKSHPQMGDYGIANHESIGSEFLKSMGFSARICGCVALHVPAKKYLASCSENYLAELSPASIETLKHQGGMMSSLEQTDFKKHPFFKDALKIRLNDDKAKVVGLMTPSLYHYQKLLERFC